MSQSAPDIQDQDKSTCTHEADWTWDWELIWRGSWVVPNFVPLLSSSSAASISKSSASSSFNKRTLSFQKKATLDTRQQLVFQGTDGVKLQPTVAEFSGIVLATPKKHSSKHMARSNTLLATELNNPFSPSKPPPSPLSKRSSTSGAPTPVMKEDTEMHLISKFHLTSFPTYLLAPGCTQPCRVFVDPGAKESTSFFEDLMDDNDISDMRARFQLGESKPIGRIGLLMSVVSKSNPNAKRKTFPSVSKQEDNPFLNGNTPADALESSAVEMKGEMQKKILQESSMFLIYAALDNGDDLDFSDNRYDAFEASGHTATTPTISYYAYPLVDPSQLLGMTLLNPGMIDMVQQTGPTVATALTGSSGYCEDDDPMVESILNGNDYDKGSEASQDSTEVDEDETLWMELSLLESLDRSRMWSPYTVLAHKETANGASDRSFSRSQTMVTVSASTKDGSRRLSSTLSRHRSEGNYGQRSSDQSLTERQSTTVRKGIGRLKSPSRAPQQPLDLSTESLRRKLLGPGSIRKSLGGRIESVASIPAGLKSPSRRKSAGANTRINMAPSALPDLTTMMMMKKKQNASLAVEASPFVVDNDPLSSPSARASSMPRFGLATQDSLGSLGLTRPKSSGSLLSTLQSIRDQDNSQGSRTDDIEKVTFPDPPTKSRSSSSSKSKAPSASLPTDLPSTSKSIESRNKNTIHGLTKSILSKNNIGSDHEDYKECAANLYRSVKFAMRKDIATKLYHLEELERLMDRHAALL
ncbi:hypothetical protein CPC16_002101 [Podila verticillata]|nr:hypothetical protein CPC16_002101 [Podila verticillata]KAI9232313.1 MAG: hypothetical protein BYD32DRAFT_428693 [Podila humilis]